MIKETNTWMYETQPIFRVTDLTAKIFPSDQLVHFPTIIEQSFFWSDALYTKPETKYFSILFHGLSIKY